MATKVVTGPNIRFSYANVFEPRSMEEGGKAKYSASLLIPKTDTKTVNDVKAAIKEAFEGGVAAKFGGKRPVDGTWKNPLRDGDAERPDDEAYKGMFFVNANSDNKPGVVNAAVQHILSQDEFYSGCIGRAAITFYAFNSNGSKGVACGLQNVQKLADGERLSGGSSAEEDFGAPAASDDLM